MWMHGEERDISDFLNKITIIMKLSNFQKVEVVVEEE